MDKLTGVCEICEVKAIKENQRLRKELEDARYSFWEISHRAIQISKNYKDAIKAGRKIDQALKDK